MDRDPDREVRPVTFGCAAGLHIEIETDGHSVAEGARGADTVLGKGQTEGFETDRPVFERLLTAQLDPHAGRTKLEGGAGHRQVVVDHHNRLLPWSKDGREEPRGTDGTPHVDPHEPGQRSVGGDELDVDHIDIGARRFVTIVGVGDVHVARVADRSGDGRLGRVSDENDPTTHAPDFDADTAVTPLGNGRYGSTLLDTWNIVAGPNGGYLAAIIGRAMTETVADPDRGLRSITVHFLARPEFDDVELDVEILRAGRSLSSVQAVMRQGDRVICSSIAAFSVPWTTTESWQLPISGHATDEGIEMDSRVAPPHAQNWRGRPIIDAPFFSGEGSPRVAQWIRSTKARPLDALELVAISDAIPPAGFPKMTTPAAMPTVDLTVHIRASLPVASVGETDLVYAECETRHVADGFADEDSHIWAADGTLLAQSRQLAITR